jgi:CHAT domain-containing protein
MARLHVRTGRHAEAEVEFRAAFELMEASLGQLLELEHRLPFFSSLRRFYNDYVDFLVASGNVVEALRVADRSRARFLRERLGMTEPEAGREPDYPRLARQLGSVVLFYWTAPDRSFLWSITDRGVVLWTLPGEDDLRSLVTDYESRILQSRDPVAEATPAGLELYDVLVAPVAAEIPAGSRVVVAPDGPLHRLSFETLLVPGREPRYWIEDVILATTPSLHLLDAVPLDAVAFDAVPLDTVPRRARDGAPSVLILGDPIPAGDGLPALPFARREIAGIASLFAPERRMVVAGEAAEPAAYRLADPARFTFIHFAAHAEANREVPLDSALLLSPGEDRHKLYAHDIVEIPLHSELVTISACRGAGSRAYSAEGLVGLAWAFLGSGAGHVIGGLWDVEDASTAELMEHLYRELVAGTDPATALRRAKLRLLASETAYRKPYYWAPFVTYTSRRPPRSP